MSGGIFSGRSALGTDDYLGPTTQTLICPTGKAFVEGECVDNIEQPPSMPPKTATPIKADSITTKAPPVAPVAAGVGGIPAWGWIALGVALLGGAWWLMGQGQEKKVRRNCRRNGKFRIGHAIAKAIAQGDVQQARRLAQSKFPFSSYSVSEARAIAGAVRHSNKKYGTRLDVREFFGGHTVIRNGKIIASSFQRYNGGVRIKRLYGSSTVTRFYVFREEDRNDASKWLEVEGFGPTPGDRKTDAIRRSGLK